MAVPLEQSACPYCGVSFPTPPQRGRLCKDCRNKFSVRISPVDGARYILTQEEAAEFEAEWNRRALLKRNGWSEGKDGVLHPPYTPAQVERRLRAELHRIRDEKMPGDRDCVQICRANNPEMCPENCPVPDTPPLSVAKALASMPIPRLCQARDGYCRCSWLQVCDDAADEAFDARLKAWVDNPKSDPELQTWHEKTKKAATQPTGCLTALLRLFVGGG